MNILDPGHTYALFKDAVGSSWVGRLSCFQQGKEFIPFMVGNERLILELVIPQHLMDYSKQPQYFFIDDAKHFLMRRDYREINLYKMSGDNFMGMVQGDEKLFSSPDIAPLFISTIRKAFFYYIHRNPGVTQFIFQAQGAYADFICSALENRNDALGRQLSINKISELVPPYYGFELDILFFKNNDLGASS